MTGAVAPTLSVISPTYREAANLPVLFDRLKSALAGAEWELIVVDDDSPDGTYKVAFALAAEDSRLRCIRRVNRLGLAGAVIEGILSSSADFVAVIDADLQHDERVLPKMRQALIDGADLAIGARVEDDTIERGLSTRRQWLSNLGANVFKLVSGLKVKDPMSGFFMMRREIVAKIASQLSPDGFKILADILLCAPKNMKIVETPYSFRRRQAGQSKLTAVVGMDFIGLVAHHASAGLLPIRFALFAAVGAIGLIVHLIVLRLMVGLSTQTDFGVDQLVATLAAMTSNFLINNEVTYREYRYRGWNKLAGLVFFALVCSVGAVANIDIASWLYKSRPVWWAAGVAGALVGVVWNYAVSTAFVWRRRPGR
ncbi:MAG TPA: glycosyltransferase family 2 protein [Roseiarcus sp.]|nr:glycosyltransferase family 2 protein [Roseiarcus sp.]